MVIDFINVKDDRVFGGIGFVELIMVVDLVFWNFKNFVNVVYD